MSRICIAALFCSALLGQQLDQAYAELRAGRLDAARLLFEASLSANPQQASARLDYAYLLLKMGETEQGRDQLKQVLSERGEDERLTLEYAYLAYETGKRAEA